MPSIAPKSTVLGYPNAAHLLRRACFNYSTASISNLANKTPQQALDILFNYTYSNTLRPVDPQNKTYIPTVPFPTITSTINFNPTDGMTIFFWMSQAYFCTTLEYKLAFWLHNCFIASSTEYHYSLQWDYFELLRFYCKGSIKELTRKITFDNIMLDYLSNRFNTNSSPNQNYAREFLELFTILKGPQIGSGNYTTYTETDVQQAARIFTGITSDGTVYNGNYNRLSIFDTTTNLPCGFINVTTHDSGNKTFSAAFNNQTINGGNTEATIRQEYDAFIDMVFNQLATAKSYARRLYRYFVGREITATIEQDIIAPLADTLFANNYNLELAVRQLLCSKHFYDEDDATVGDNTIGSMVKSPMDLQFKLWTAFQLSIPTFEQNGEALHSFLWVSYGNFYSQSFVLFWPTSVNGYPPISSGPTYDKQWVNTTTLRLRYRNTINELLNGYIYYGFNFKLDTPLFIRNSGLFTNPANAENLVQDFYKILFVSAATGTRHDFFKNALLGGLSSINWQNEWNNYISTNNATSVKIALDRLTIALVNSAEYQTM